MRTALEKLYADVKNVEFSVPDCISGDAADAAEAAIMNFMEDYWPCVRDLVTSLRFSVTGIGDAMALELCAVYPEDFPATAGEEIETALGDFSCCLTESFDGYGCREYAPVDADGMKVKFVKVEMWAVEDWWYRESQEQEDEDGDFAAVAEEAPETDTLVDTNFGIRFGDERKWLFD